MAITKKQNHEKSKVIKFKERVKGNTLYSVGFVSEHRDNTPMVLNQKTVKKTLFKPIHYEKKK